MKLNPGYFWAKLLKYLDRPALRDCAIDKTARVGAGSNCIRVTMGRYSYMGAKNAACDVTMGAFFSVASHCSIGGGAHPLDAISTSPVFHAGRNILGVNFSDAPAPKPDPVTIGSDVWIGEMAFIMPGVTIGHGAVVGAHSVVTHDVPPYAVVAGAPAKVLRYRFDDETIRTLLRLKWWERDDETLRALGGKFSDAQALIAALEEAE